MVSTVRCTQPLDHFLVRPPLPDPKNGVSATFSLLAFLDVLVHLVCIELLNISISIAIYILQDYNMHVFSVSLV